jgi:two-component system, chemotaxis family, chemotaxis protein CheY
MAENYDFSKLQCLVVDDNRNMRMLTKTILHSLGIKTTREAEDGADAIKELSTFPADFVIVDWVMNPLDGIDFIRLVRNASDSPNLYLPIIMLTGHTEAARIAEARDAGVTEILAKPISIKSLCQRVVEIIERPRQFVRTTNYFGPSRRREKNPAKYRGPERRINPQE